MCIRFYHHNNNNNNNNNETMDDNNKSHPLINTLRLQSSQSKQRPLLHQPSFNSRSCNVLTSSRSRSSTKCGSCTCHNNYNSESVAATVVVMTATETIFKANHDDTPLMLRRRVMTTISRSVLLLLLLLLPGINVLVVAFTTRTTTTTTTTISTNAIITLPSFITETSQKHFHYHQRKSNVRSYRRCCFNVMVVRPQQSSDLQSTVVTTNNNINDSINGSVMIGTDPTTKPNYDTIIGPFGTFVDELCLTLFRNQLRDEVLRSYSTMDDDENKNNITKNNSRTKNTLRADPMYYETANYTQIVTLAAAMNARYPSGQQQKIQQSALNVLISLFPKWLPKWYRILFAQPFPIFSAKMNAYVTAALGVWLMGECTVNDIDMVTTTTVTNTTTNTLLSSSSAAAAASLLPIGTNQGVLVTRCRFLEESQCASICIHSCKIPTQNFFWQQMGVPLLMEPNYTTGSCQFSFGRYPNTTTETTSIQTPCLSRCPTSGSYRSNHMVSRSSSNGSSTVLQNVHFDNATTTVKTSMCSMIEDVHLLT